MERGPKVIILSHIIHKAVTKIIRVIVAHISGKLARKKDQQGSMQY